MKKLIALFALLIAFTSCVREETLICGEVVNEIIELDRYGYEYYYIEILTDYGNYREFEVSRRSFYNTDLGDYTCYE